MAQAPDERYTIRAKLFDIVPQFHVYDASGELIGYCRQKLFKFREEIILYTDKSREKELLRINARQVIDFSATYDVSLPDGTGIGSLRRKGMRSTFFRDAYLLFDADNNQVGSLQEDSAWRGVLRRYVDYASMLLPQRFHLTDANERRIATLRQHFNPFVLRLGIAIHHEDERLDDLMLIATGLLAAAIEGRQR